MNKATICGIFLAGVLPAVSADRPTCNAENTVKADVVAIEHAFQYNRFGSFNPAGMIFALRHDVAPANVAESYFDKPVDERLATKLEPGNVRLRKDKRPRPLVLRVNEGQCLEVTFTNLISRVPPFLANKVVPEHVLSPTDSTLPVLLPVGESEFPATRAVSLHVNGLDYVGSIGSDAANVGNNPNSLSLPGEAPKKYTWYAKREGGFLMYSTGAMVGGEGDGGQIGLGLFGSVNVEPARSTWFRSQVTHEVIKKAATQPDGSVDYARVNYHDPSIAILKDHRIVHSDLNAIIEQDATKPGESYCPDEGPGNSCGLSFREFTVIFHDEITATQAFYELSDETNPISSVRDGMGINYGVSAMGPMVLANLKQIGPAAKCAECKFEEFFLASWANGDPALLTEYPDDPSNVHHSYLGDPVRFRNMHAGPKETHVFHLHAHQWLYDFRDQHSTYLDSQTISPGASYTYAIQYGGSGNRNFTVGDSIFHCHLYPHFAQGMWELWRSHDAFEDGTAGVWDAATNPRGRSLPDGEIPEGTPNPAVLPIRGHALAPLPNKEFGGYPFFIPGRAGHRPPQAPLDLDMNDKGEELNGGLTRHIVLEGESRTGAERDKDEMFSKVHVFPKGSTVATPGIKLSSMDAVDLGAQASQYIARRVWSQNSNPAFTLFGKELVKATIHRLPREGTPGEQFAMRYHQGLAKGLDFQGASGQAAPYNAHVRPESPNGWGKAMGYYSPIAGAGKGAAPGLFGVNGRIGREVHDGAAMPKYLSRPGAPYADPCPTEAALKLRPYRAAYLQLDLTVNKWGWHDPQARAAVLEEDLLPTLKRERPAEPLFFRANSGECIQFAATNLIPSVLNLDDFQIYSPTDIIGQHIHLVKFDVTASDGSGNGWNYEDGTLSADEVRERIRAHNLANPGDPIKLVTNPLFKTGVLKDDKRGWCGDMGKEGSDENPWCGAQTTVQRWYADPILDRNQQDRTMRTVFTHDHFGPSSHQHHGLYAALVVEPAGSQWWTLDGKHRLGREATDWNRKDGGPTSYRANIISPKQPALSRREFNLAFADFALLYTKDLDPVNTSNRTEAAQMPGGVEHDPIPAPEGISGGDPGTQLINYRNEPIPLRIAEKNEARERYTLRDGARSDMANIFNTPVHAPTDHLLKDTTKSGSGDGTPVNLVAALESQRLTFMKRLFCNDSALNSPKSPLVERQRPYFCEEWRKEGDPGTPLLAAYEGDKVQVRLVQGAQEEQHIFSMNGVKWPMQVGSTWPAKKPGEGGFKPQPVDLKASGYMNAQQIGISEHMEFDAPVALRQAPTTDYMYMSTATDNLWDGMWGFLRSFGSEEGGNNTFKMHTGLARIDTTPLDKSEMNADADAGVCPDDAFKNAQLHYVGAWLARDLVGDWGLVYNRRFLLHDPNAIVFVELDPRYSALGASHYPLAELKTNLQYAYQHGKVMEPLILRAPAGACVKVRLFNFIPADYDDRWKHPDQVRKEMNAKPTDNDARKLAVENKLMQANGSFNILPPITDGVNFNQVRAGTEVGLHPQLLEANTSTMDGANTGENKLSTARPGGPYREYIWYAGEVRLLRENGVRKAKHIPMEFGGVGLRDLADPVKHTSHGAVGMLIVEPQGVCATFPEDKVRESGAEPIVLPADPLNGPEQKAYEDAGYCKSDDHDGTGLRRQYYRSKATADIRQEGKILFRDFGLIYQDDLSLMQGGLPLPNLRGGDDAEDSGAKGFNYRTEPLWARVGAGSSDVKPEEMRERDFSNVLSSTANNDGCNGPCGDPETPVFHALAGTEVRFHVIHPGGHPRQHGFSLYGHSWQAEPWQWSFDKKSGAWAQVMGTNHYSAALGSFSGVGPGRHLNIRTCAGGEMGIEGDYLFRTQEAFQFQGGLWGLFRVDHNPDLKPQCDAAMPYSEPEQGVSVRQKASTKQ